MGAFLEKEQMSTNIYWTPTTNEFYDNFPCLACSAIMTTQIQSQSPQKINTCGHVVCFQCINTSYIINESLLCPVSNCIKPINPDDLPSFLNAAETQNAISEDDYTCFACGNTNCYNECNYNTSQFCKGVTSKQYYCLYEDCIGECGTLWCGCIDICRRRCAK